MPAWSEEIAQLFVAFAERAGEELTQMQLQKLVYIAHGWRLLTSGEPLTGDRPEAAATGPSYRRLSDRLAGCGIGAVQVELLPSPDASALDQTELEVITAVWNSHRGLAAEQLSAVTRSVDAPWSVVWAGGRGRGQEISHQLVREQFASFAQVFESTRPRHGKRELGAAESSGR